MEKYAIKKLVECGKSQQDNDYHIGAFAIYWIASEAILVRGLVKSLWLRGVPLRDAKSFVETMDTNKVELCLSAATGIWLQRNDKTLAGIRLQQSLRVVRNKLFHSGLAPNPNTLLNATRFLFDYAREPAPFWSDIQVLIPTSGALVSLGDPIADLRSVRRPATSKQSAEGLFAEWNEINKQRNERAVNIRFTHQKPNAKIDWSEDELVRRILDDFRFADTEEFRVMRDKLRKARTLAKSGL